MQISGRTISLIEVSSQGRRERETGYRERERKRGERECEIEREKATVRTEGGHDFGVPGGTQRV